ncbi:MAG: hypothetical protein LBD60_03360 [Puniceicoccales bacterium]|nr:hypothetical protein [Puniceicoccales bacterium]
MLKEIFSGFCLQFLLLSSLFGGESLFLRAKGPYRDLQGKGSETQKEFDVGGGKFEKGDFVCIANPAYDLTFKALFTPMRRFGELGYNRNVKKF